MGRRRTSRPDYFWGNFGDTLQGLDLGATAAVFGTTGLFKIVPCTLLRVRGRVSVNLDAGGVNERATILCGLIRINADSFTAGGAPEILTNQDDEASWLWQGSLYVDSGGEAAVNENRLIDSIEIDSKAMRKLKPGEGAAFVFHTPAELVVDQAGTFDLSYYFHVLFQS